MQHVVRRGQTVWNYLQKRRLRDLDNNSSRKGSLPPHGIGHSDFGRLILQRWLPLLDVGSADIIKSKRSRDGFNSFWHFHRFLSPHLTSAYS